MLNRDMNFPTGAAAFSFFGETSRPTWLDNVVCMGNETRLYDCQYAEIGVHNCSHAGVRCQRKKFCLFCTKNSVLSPNLYASLDLYFCSSLSRW